MHLIYIWVQEYRIIREQGISLSSKYDINIKSISIGDDHLPVCQVDIQRNKDFVKNFFGPGIIDISAIVGQNGSGKTTLAHMIMEYAPESLKIANSFSSLNTERNDEETSKYSGFFIYEDDTSEACNLYIIANNMKAKCINDSQINECDMYQFNYTSLQPIVYLSNIFNPAELKESFTLGDIGIGNYPQQQIYTPAVIIKRQKETRLHAYHHWYNGVYNSALYSLAEIQMQDATRVYEDYQTTSFLNCYFHSPDCIKAELPIFSNITIHFRPFAEELTFEEEEKELLDTWLDSLSGSTNASTYEEKRKAHYSPRYILEFCKINIYRYYTNKNASINLKYHILVCLFSEVIALFFGKYLAILYDDVNYFMSDRSNIAKIDFWIDFKQKIDNILTPDDSNTRCIKNIFEKYYKEVSAILSIEKKLDIMPGTYPLEQIETFLKFYEDSYTKCNSWTKYVSLEIHPSSSGELAMTNLVSYMYQAFKKFSANEGDILLIIDEIDAFLHPRWQQKALNWLLKWWQDDHLFKKYRMQVLFTSHSPILISDIPGDRVTWLSIEEQKPNGCIHMERKRQKTFGADIYSLFYNSFFMDKGSIGTFAHDKINKLINWLKEDQECPSEMEDHEAYYLIKAIGDHNAAVQLEQMYKERKNKAMKVEAFRHQLENLSPEEQKILNEFIKNKEKSNDSNSIL